MSHPDEGLIHAWLDGELDAEEAARVERLVADDKAWAAAAAEARGLIAASARILSHLDSVPGDVVPKDAEAGGAGGGGHSSASTRQVAARPHKGFTVRPWMRLAAGLVLVAGLGYAARSAFTGASSAPMVASSEEAEKAAGPSDAGGASLGRAGASGDAPVASSSSAPTATTTATSVATPPATQTAAAKSAVPANADAALAAEAAAVTPDSITTLGRAVAEAKAAQAKAAQAAGRLDASNAVLGWVRLHTGGLDSSLVDPRLVFGVALQTASAAIVVAHNHPSGNVEPSQQDEVLTQRLAVGAKLLGVRLLDHLILGREGSYSFASAGKLEA